MSAYCSHFTKSCDCAEWKRNIAKKEADNKERNKPATHCKLCDAELSPYKGWIKRMCRNCGEVQS